MVSSAVIAWDKAMDTNEVTNGQDFRICVNQTEYNVYLVQIAYSYSMERSVQHVETALKTRR